MIINDAITKAQAQEEEKVAISLKVSSHTKSKLQKIADENRISLNNLCTSILESALDGKIDERGTLQLIEELNKAKANYTQALEMIEIGEFTVEAENGTIIDFRLEKMVNEAKVYAITSELKRRN